MLTIESIKEQVINATCHIVEDDPWHLVKLAQTGRHPKCDHALILLMYRHGLRVSEASELRWHQIDWKLCQIHISRKKEGKPSVHPLKGDKLRLLRALRREHPDHPFLFIGELGSPLSERSIHRDERALG